MVYIPTNFYFLYYHILIVTFLWQGFSDGKCGHIYLKVHNMNKGFQLLHVTLMWFTTLRIVGEQ